MNWIWLLLALVPIAIVASGVFLCLPYLRSPEKCWRDSVLRAYQAARRQVQVEQAQLQRLSKNHQDENQSLSRKAFERFLSSISVNELEAYPGIGPATAGRLKQAGFNNLARLQNARIRVSGLGQKRLADVYGAVRQLTRQAESRFQAGACPESQRLTGQLQQLELQYAELHCRANARVKGATDVIRQLDESVAVARQVTFWNYLWRDAHAVVPPELLHRALPDLLSAVTAAEQQAVKVLRGQEAAGNSRSESKSRTVTRSAVSTKPVARPTPIPQQTKERPAPIRSPERRSSSLQSSPAPIPSRSTQSQIASDPAQELLEAIIEFAFAIARTDGSISRKETGFIQEQMQRRCRHDAALYNRAKAWCAHYATVAIDIGSCLQRVKEKFTPAQRGQLLELGCQIAEASGPINRREMRLLERASREWEVPWKPPVVVAVATPEPPEPSPAQVAAVSPGLEARTLLEIDASTQLTADLIRRQYNLLSSRLAPGKLESLGPEFVAMAESKRQAIRAAAAALIGPLGEPLDLPAKTAGPAELRHNPDLDAMFGA
jgi:hypothetical protein